MIVDLLRNDLARLVYPNRVRVPELFTLERYETVWQLTSSVEADVLAGTTLLDVFRCLFPCGSVTGAPKIAAMAIIDELEAEPRGVYCGAIGVLAPAGQEPRAVFSVPIRTAVIDTDATGGSLTYGVGAGITWSSDPDAEDAEVTAKSLVLRTRWPAFELLETLRRDAAGARNLAEHLERMEASAEWFGIPFDRGSIERAVLALPSVTAPHRLRLLLDRQGGATIDQRPLDPAPDPVRLAIDREATPAGDLFACHKTTARARYDAARARHPEADDVVLVNEKGSAVETTTANLAFRIEGRWWVPPLTDGGLPGIARALALARGTVAERSISAASLHRCDELAVLNDLRGWRSASLVTDRC
jgi:para-aminobenzoate synthetase/4-amino-4-deoxychorismate lyase